MVGGAGVRGVWWSFFFFLRYFNYCFGIVGKCLVTSYVFLLPPEIVRTRAHKSVLIEA